MVVENVCLLVRLGPVSYRLPEYSWDGSSDKLKESLIGLMATYCLAESSFGGVTAQLEVFERVGLAYTAAVSDMQRHGFLKRPTTKKDFENKEVRSGANIISCFGPTHT